MICFLDKSFCKSDCVNTSCSRNMTADVQKRADEWWEAFKSNDPTPIAFMDLKAGCDDYLAPQREDA